MPYPLLFLLASGALCLAVWWRLGSESVGTVAAVPPTAAPARAGANTPVARQRVGLIAGHNAVKTLPGGDVARDPAAPLIKGAVCADSPVIEADLTLDITRRVATLLRAERIEVDILGEFDPRLDGYFGAALVSLHVDDCVRGFSGYKAVRWTKSPVPAASDRLVNCLKALYAATTGLAEHPNTITRNMTEYHAFREIAPSTPAAIIELGFIRDDLALLQSGDLPAKGVAGGIRCFLAAS